MTTRPPSDLDSDEQLLARTADGDPRAFALLFRRRHGQVYRFALHMTGIAALADDVTQDVFLVVMRDAVRYQSGRSGVAAWLCGIARNCARQRLDRDRPFQPLDDEDDSGGADVRGPRRAFSARREGMAPQTDPLGDLTRAEGIERVRKAVLSLPVRYREVVVLCDLQELSYAEAADALACAVGTVRSRLHRGRQLLADKLSATDPATEKLGEAAKPGEAANLSGSATQRGSAKPHGSAKPQGSRSCA